MGLSIPLNTCSCGRHVLLVEEGNNEALPQDEVLEVLLTSAGSVVEPCFAFQFSYLHLCFVLLLLKLILVSVLELDSGKFGLEGFYFVLVVVLCAILALEIVLVIVLCGLFLASPGRF